MEQDIGALVRAVRGGESEAFQEFYQATKRRVYYQVRMLMREQQDTEDLVQEVYTRLFEKLDTLRDDQAAVAWIDTVTRNLCLTALKRKKRQIFRDEGGEEVLELLPEEDKQYLPEESLDDEESRQMMRELVDGLPEAQAQTVYLYYFSELSVQQIAQELGISEGTVKSRMNTARGKLRTDINELRRKGIKIFSITALAVLLQKDAQACTLPAELEGHILRHVSELAAASGAGAIAAGAVAEGGTAAGTAASSGATTAGAAGAAATSGTAVAAKGMALGVKLLLGAVAATAVVGGGVAVWAARQPAATPAPTQPPAQTRQVQETPPAQTTPPPGATPTPAPEETVPTQLFVPEELIGKSIADLKAIYGEEDSLSTGGGRDNYNWKTPKILAATTEGDEIIRSFILYTDIPLHGLVAGGGVEGIEAAWGDLTFRDGPVSMREEEGVTMYFYEDDRYTYQANVKDGVVQYVSLYHKGNP